MRIVYLCRGRLIWTSTTAAFLVIAVGTVLPWAGARAADTPSNTTRTGQAPRLTKPGSRPADSPVIRFDVQTYDFGRVMAGRPLDHKFPFTNTGNQSLLITSVKTGCGCITSGPYDKHISPGGSGKIPVSLFTRGRNGKVRKSIVVTTNDPGLPTLQLELVGEILGPIGVYPPSVQFGTLQDDVKQRRVLKITNNTDTPMELTKIRHVSADLETELKTLIPGKEFELTVTAVPPFAPGYLNSAIHLTTNLPEMPRLTITATGRKSSAITLVPDVVFLPSPLPDGFKKRILVCHSKGRLLKLTDLKVTGEKLQVGLDKSQPRVMHLLILAGPAGYEVPDTGEQITFCTDDPSMPQVTLRVIPNCLIEN